MTAQLPRCLLMLALLTPGCASTTTPSTALVPVGTGWAANSVNANILRHNSIVSHDGTQYIAYYDADQHVVLAKRALGSTDWQTHRTQYTGNTKDAHNIISIMVDGDGYLHVSWDHHNHPLRYARSVAPGSLELTDKLPMTGVKESRVTYPEFYRLPSGDLIFLYRDGASGNGNLMLNRYHTAAKKWTQVQDAFIHGQGQRSPYWQMCTDAKGNLHVSWVWRETGDVATNHDMAYAVSPDGGVTWQRTDGSAYDLPITAADAEYAARIPQKHELINTTSMCADSAGRPYIVTYFRPPGTDVPQYHLIHFTGRSDEQPWRTLQITERTTPFRLSGGGSKRIPISRPRIIVDTDGPTDRAYLLYRDEERGSKVTVAICDDLANPTWRHEDLTDFTVGMWEPSYDTELWAAHKVLHLFVQHVEQGDGDKTVDFAPQPIHVLEWRP